mgnify:CR=1 FL=1
MYKISKTKYGLHIEMGGIYGENEIEEYIFEKEKLMSELDGPFSLIIDLRTAIPPKFEDVELLKDSQSKMNDSKLHKMVIIVNSPIIMGQAKQVGFLAGIESKTKYINASIIENWEEEALNWVNDDSLAYP